ncbi:MAG: S1 RNA-binding domain-containing protein [Myxococcota bacterium]
MPQWRPGDRIASTVVRVTDFGLFIDLGEFTGLVPLHEMSWGTRNPSPKDCFEIGDQVLTVVLKVLVDDRRVLLGTRQLRPDPWADAVERYAEGSKVRGRVTLVAPYGAIVSPEEEMEGLLHISRLPEGSDLPRVAEAVEVVVLKVDPVERRMLFGVPSTQLGT